MNENQLFDSPDSPDGPDPPGETPEQRRRRLQTATRVMPQDVTKYAKPKLPFRAMPEWGGVPDITKPGQGSTPLIDPRQQPQQQKDLLRPPPAQLPGPRAEPVMDEERPQRPRARVEQPGIPVLGRISRGVSRMILGDPEKAAIERERAERQRLSDIQDINRGDRPGPEWWKRMERTLSRASERRKAAAAERTERVPKQLRQAMNLEGPVFETAGMIDPKVRMALGVARAMGMTPKAVAEDPLGALGPDLPGVAQIPLVGRAAAEAAESGVPMFYSRLEKVLENFPQPRATGQQWLSALEPGKVRGGKLIELEEGPLKQFLEQNKEKVLTKEEVLEARKAKVPETEEGIPLGKDERAALEDQLAEIEVELNELQARLKNEELKLTVEQEDEMIDRIDELERERMDVVPKLHSGYSEGAPREQITNIGRERLRVEMDELEEEIRRLKHEHERWGLSGAELEELRDMERQHIIMSNRWKYADVDQRGGEPLQLSETRYGSESGPVREAKKKAREELDFQETQLAEYQETLRSNIVAGSEDNAALKREIRKAFAGDRYDQALLGEKRVKEIEEWMKVDADMRRVSRERQKLKTEPDYTKYEEYVTPGLEGTRYRELLVSRALPDVQQAARMEREYNVAAQKANRKLQDLRTALRNADPQTEAIVDEQLEMLVDAADEGLTRFQNSFYQVMRDREVIALPVEVRAAFVDWARNKEEAVKLADAWTNYESPAFRSGHWEPRDIQVHLRARVAELPFADKKLAAMQEWVAKNVSGAPYLPAWRHAYEAWKQKAWTLEDAADYLRASPRTQGLGSSHLADRIRQDLLEQVLIPAGQAGEFQIPPNALPALREGVTGLADVLGFYPLAERKKIMSDAIEKYGGELSKSEKYLLTEAAAGRHPNVMGVTATTRAKSTSMHAEEMQSDWAAALRDLEKLKKTKPVQVNKPGEWQGYWKLDTPQLQGLYYNTEEEAIEALGKRVESESKRVPPMPLKRVQDWSKLGMQRLIHEAVEEGAQHISWTAGKEQLRRYSLAQYVDSIRYEPEIEMLVGYKGNRIVVRKEGVSPDKLSDYVGGPAAKQLLETPFEEGKRYHELSVNDLPVGETGLNDLYENVYVKTIKDYWKQLGLGEPNIFRADLSETGNEIVVELPQKLIDMVKKEGQPLGIVAPEVLGALGGGGAGALAGATEGDTPEDRVRNALLGAVGGAAAGIAGSAAVRAAGRKSMVKPTEWPNAKELPRKSMEDIAGEVVKKKPVYPETESTMKLVREQGEADRRAIRELQENLKAVGSEAPPAVPRDPAGREIPQSPGRVAETPEGDVFRVPPPELRMQGPRRPTFAEDPVIQERLRTTGEELRANAERLERQRKELALPEVAQREAGIKLNTEAYMKKLEAWSAVEKEVRKTFPQTSHVFMQEIRSRTLSNVLADPWVKAQGPEFQRLVKAAFEAEEESKTLEKSVREHAKSMSKIPTRAPEQLRPLQEFLLRLDKQPLSREHHTFLRIAEQKIRKGEYNPEEVRKLLEKISSSPLEVEFKTLIRQQLRDLPAAMD